MHTECSLYSRSHFSRHDQGLSHVSEMRVSILPLPSSSPPFPFPLLTPWRWKIGVTINEQFKNILNADITNFQRQYWVHQLYSLEASYKSQGRPNLRVSDNPTWIFAVSGHRRQPQWLHHWPKRRISPNNGCHLKCAKLLYSPWCLWQFNETAIENPL